MMPKALTSPHVISAELAAQTAMPTGRALISYVRENSPDADRLQRILEDADIPVRRDTVHLWPGQNWRAHIRGAITRDSLAFLACFSHASGARLQSYQNEELNEAIRQPRLRLRDITCFIPVLFDDCQIPDLDIGDGRTLRPRQGD